MKNSVAIITNNTECEKHIQYYSTLEKYFDKNSWQVEDHFRVDKAVICACGFHDFMYKKITNVLEELKSSGLNEENILILGCLPKTHEKELASDFSGTVVELGDEHELDRFFNANVKFSDINPTHLFAPVESDPYQMKYYIKVAKGCMQKCTFCVINKAKGKLVSESRDRIMEEFREAIANGYRNIFLMAEDTFAYGMDTGTNIIELVEAMIADAPEVNFHFGSLHIWWLKDYADGIISLCERGYVKHLHVGLQHVSDSILKRMGRAVIFDEVYAILCRIKEKCPQVLLSADILVGFPGERPEDFDQLNEFFKQDQCFDQVSHFGFSDVKGAASFHFKDKVDPMQVAYRWDLLREILGKRSYYNQGDKKDEKYRQAYISTFDNDYAFCRKTYINP